MNEKTKNNLLGKIIIVIWIILFMLNVFVAVMASDGGTTVEIAKPNQYFELKATEIEDVGDTKQVKMELWAHDLHFKRNECKI